MFEGQKGSQRSACRDVMAIVFIFITQRDFITFTATALMTIEHINNKEYGNEKHVKHVKHVLTN